MNTSAPKSRDAVLPELRMESLSDGSIRIYPAAAHLRVGKSARDRVAAALAGEIDVGLSADVALWLRTVYAANGAPGPGWPSEVDIRKSFLLSRIRSGKTPLPYAPPTNHSYPWYEVIEQAHVRRRVLVEQEDQLDRWSRPGLRSIYINQCPWTILEIQTPGQEYLVTYGQWPLTWRLSFERVRRYPEDLPGLEVAEDEHWISMPKGWPISSATAGQIRAHRHDTMDAWFLQCISERSVRLYVHGGQVESESGHTIQVLQTREGRPFVILRGQNQVVSSVWREIAWDPVDRVSRYVKAAVQGQDDRFQELLREWSRGVDPLARMRSWQDLIVVEAAAHGADGLSPIGTWKVQTNIALDRDLDEPVTAPPVARQDP